MLKLTGEATTRSILMDAVTPATARGCRAEPTPLGPASFTQPGWLVDWRTSDGVAANVRQYNAAARAEHVFADPFRRETRMRTTAILAGALLCASLGPARVASAQAPAGPPPPSTSREPGGARV